MKWNIRKHGFAADAFVVSVGILFWVIIILFDDCTPSSPQLELRIEESK